MKNLQSGKIIEISVGQTLSATYIGYMGQLESVKGMVLSINDSIIQLSDFARSPGIFMKKTEDMFLYKNIRISDLQRFRRITVWRQFAKAITTAALVTGTYILIYSKLNSTNTGIGEKFIYATLSGMAVFSLTELIFPENPKYKLTEGWQVEVK